MIAASLQIKPRPRARTNAVHDPAFLASGNYHIQLIASDHQSIQPRPQPCPPKMHQGRPGEEWRGENNTMPFFIVRWVWENQFDFPCGKFQRHHSRCMVWSRNVSMTSSGRSLEGGIMHP